MRIAVVGNSGSGKTTLAKRLEVELGLPRIELDQINWQAGWRDLNTHDPAEFVRRTEAALAREAWVCDGNYGKVRDHVWTRATDLIWLDYERSVIMPQLFKRSLMRALDQKELWPGTGNRERFSQWLQKDHPLRYSWDNWARRRGEYAQRVLEPQFAHLRVHRLKHPKEIPAMIDHLRLTA